MSGYRRSQLGAYCLGLLDPDEVRTTSRHLDRCPECRAVLAELESTRELLELLTPAAVGA